MLPSGELQQETLKIAAELSTRARSTIAATKAMMLRLRDHRRPPAGAADDIIRECYGSAEFKEGVEAFLDGRQPELVSPEGPSRPDAPVRPLRLSGLIWPLKTGSSRSRRRRPSSTAPTTAAG